MGARACNRTGQGIASQVLHNHCRMLEVPCRLRRVITCLADLLQEGWVMLFAYMP
jgi:hypothetical protein